ncbi:MAG TPA: cytochrome P450 [Solirubrobacteraceae bacterium]|nr:cytochrome P450 [Solirubrobacteraceae bacterium]
MPLITEMELPQLDYLDPDLRGPRYHEIVSDLRSRGWLASSPLAYVVLERDAASFFLRTKSATFPGKQIAELFGIGEGPLHEEIQRNILHIDGADHRRLRNLVNPAFTPRAADKWRPVMRGFLDELYAELPPSGETDFVESFCKPYPSLTIAAVMGAPHDDAPRLAEWSNWIQRPFDGPTLLAERDRVERACAEFYEWADAMLAVRRATPGEDLVSTLIAEEQDGDRLSDVELVNLVLNVLVGGVDTTQSQLAHAVRLFAEHPDQWQLVRSDPEAYVPRAVDEALRYEPITPFTARIMTEDVEYGGVTFPEGTIVLVAPVTANRDGIEDADRFDVTREPTKPLTFGAGIHYCLGANLAKAELQEALTLLAARVERFELTAEPEFDTVQGVYGMVSLPVRLVPA